MAYIPDNSILTTIKSMLGVDADDHSFDADIIVHIGSAINMLDQLGVSPEAPLHAFEQGATWDDLTRDANVRSMAKAYIYLKVRLAFDPPASSALLQAMDKELGELGWRITNR